MSERQQKIFDAVQAITVELFGCREDQVKPETSFINDLGADSLDAVELIMEIEDRFDITVTDEEAEKMMKVQDVVAWLDENEAKV